MSRIAMSNHFFTGRDLTSEPQMPLSFKKTRLSSELLVIRD